MNNLLIKVINTSHRDFTAENAHVFQSTSGLKMHDITCISYYIEISRINISLIRIINTCYSVVVTENIYVFHSTSDLKMHDITCISYYI